MPHGNVDDPLTFADGVLMVCGPIIWEGDGAGDTPARSVDVRAVKVVRVDPATGQAGAQIGTFSRTVPFAAGVEDWMVNVQISPEQPLEPGDRVHVSVQALVHLVDGGARPEPWDHDATITDLPEDGGAGAVAGGP